MNVHSLASGPKAGCTPALASNEAGQHNAGQLLVFPQSGITRIPEELRQAAECLAHAAFHAMQRRGKPCSMADCYRRAFGAIRDLIPTVPMESARQSQIVSQEARTLVGSEEGAGVASPTPGGLPWRKAWGGQR